MSDEEDRSSATSILDSVDAAETTSALFMASRDLLPVGSVFAPHAHQEDQLAWAPTGSVEVDVLGERWQARAEHAIWIPAGVVHEMRFPEACDLVSIYIDPLLRPDGDWRAPRVMATTPLVSGILLHLSEGTPTTRRRSQCRRLLYDLLPELSIVRDAVALPRDPRARHVAAGLRENPADDRDLDAWAAELQVSSKTLARAFVAGTGKTFRDWRVSTRLQEAARRLAEGESVQDTAELVGYTSVSSFIAAFRSRFGMTPGRYASEVRQG